jgi:hypothetical protein
VDFSLSLVPRIAVAETKTGRSVGHQKIAFALIRLAASQHVAVGHTVAQEADIVTRTSHPGKRHRAAAGLVGEALADAFPCKR